MHYFMHNSRVSGNVTFSFTLKVFMKNLIRHLTPIFILLKKIKLILLKKKLKKIIPQCNATHSISVVGVLFVYYHMTDSVY